MREIDPNKDRHHLLCFAACAKTFAAAIETMFQDATGDCFIYEPDIRRMHAGDGSVAEAAWADMQRFCQRFGIGTPQVPTEGAPCATAEVDAGDAEPACSKCGRWPIRGCCEFGIGEPQPTTEGEPATEVDVTAEVRCHRCGSGRACGCYDPPLQTREDR